VEKRRGKGGEDPRATTEKGSLNAGSMRKNEKGEYAIYRKRSGLFVIRSRRTPAEKKKETQPSLGFTRRPTKGREKKVGERDANFRQKGKGRGNSLLFSERAGKRKLSSQTTFSQGGKKGKVAQKTHPVAKGGKKRKGRGRGL